MTPNFAVGVGLGPQVVDGALHVAHALVIRHVARGPGRSRSVVWAGAGGVTMVEVGQDGRVAVMSKLARHLLIPLIPTGHVVEYHHPGEGAAAGGAGVVGRDKVAVVSFDEHRFSDHGFISY